MADRGAVPRARGRNAALAEWYRADHRNLPWRSTTDPYRILVSEVMLQQTQAARVVPYYERFVASYPTIHDLAAASLADVLRHWSGLGYNSRARRLHDAAVQVAANGWPSSIEAMMELPGVGAYTAAAVGSFAFGWQVPAVDTNAKRVLSRWHGEPLRGAVLHRTAVADLGDSDAALWNQAVMELGATVCAPRVPACQECPVLGWCVGPEVYEPPRPQRRFEGSGRQVRGALMRRLVAGPASLPVLADAADVDLGAADEALADLMAEGLVTRDGEESFRLPD